jgi:hypothetical protein
MNDALGGGSAAGGVTADIRHGFNGMAGCIGDPDLLVCTRTTEGGEAKHRVLIVGEAKTPWTLVHRIGKHMETFDSAETIAAGWGDGPPPAGDKEWGKGLGGHMRRAIAQTIGYMVDNGRRYGFLTTYQKTWFFCATTFDKVLVTDAVCDIHANNQDEDQPSLLRAMAYVVERARENGDMPPYEVYRTKRRLTGGELVELPASSRARKTLVKHGPNSAPLPGVDLEAPVNPSEAEQAFDSLDVVIVPRDLLVDEGVLGEGRGGAVFAAKWGTTPVAIKWFDISKGRGPAMMREIEVYQHLEARKADVAPHVLLKTVSPSGQCLGLGFEMGTPMDDDLSTWSAPLRADADQLVKDLATQGMHTHTAGLAHAR